MTFHLDLMECNSVVECCADNAEVVSSNLTIPIVAFGQHKTLMGCFKTTLEVWQSGLSQNPAKIPCLVIGTVGSNPTTSVGLQVSVYLNIKDRHDHSAERVIH